MSSLRPTIKTYISNLELNINKSTTTAKTVTLTKNQREHKQQSHINYPYVPHNLECFQKMIHKYITVVRLIWCFDQIKNFKQN